MAFLVIFSVLGAHVVENYYLFLTLCACHLPTLV